MHHMHKGRNAYPWHNPPRFEPPHMTGLVIPSQGLTVGPSALQVVRWSPPPLSQIALAGAPRTCEPGSPRMSAARRTPYTRTTSRRGSKRLWRPEQKCGTPACTWWVAAPSCLFPLRKRAPLVNGLSCPCPRLFLAAIPTADAISPFRPSLAASFPRPPQIASHSGPALADLPCRLFTRPYGRPRAPKRARVQLHAAGAAASPAGPRSAAGARNTPSPLARSLPPHRPRNPHLRPPRRLLRRRNSPRGATPTSSGSTTGGRRWTQRRNWTRRGQRVREGSVTCGCTAPFTGCPCAAPLPTQTSARCRRAC